MKLWTLIGVAAYMAMLVCGPNDQDREQRIHESLLVVLIIGAVLGGKEK